MFLMTWNWKRKAGSQPNNGSFLSFRASSLIERCFGSLFIALVVLNMIPSCHLGQLWNILYWLVQSLSFLILSFHLFTHSYSLSYIVSFTPILECLSFCPAFLTNEQHLKAFHPCLYSRADVYCNQPLIRNTWSKLKKPYYLCCLHLILWCASIF